MSIRNQPNSILPSSNFEISHHLEMKIPTNLTADEHSLASVDHTYHHTTEIQAVLPTTSTHSLAEDSLPTAFDSFPGRRFSSHNFDTFPGHCYSYHNDTTDIKAVPTTTSTPSLVVDPLTTTATTSQVAGSLTNKATHHLAASIITHQASSNSSTSSTSGAAILLHITVYSFNLIFS